MRNQKRQNKSQREDGNNNATEISYVFTNIPVSNTFTKAGLLYGYFDKVSTDDQIHH